MTERSTPSSRGPGGKEAHTAGEAGERTSGEASAQAEADDEQAIRGPHAWLNWQAQRAGQPAQGSSTVIVLPRWEEFGLYSDAHFIGELAFGPYQLMLAFTPRRSSYGDAQLSLVLRAQNHLVDASHEPMNLDEQDDRAYAGGDLGDQIASLLALAVGRRMRSGGRMRRAYEDDDAEGRPDFGNHHPPPLLAPRYAPMLPSIAEQAGLASAESYLLAFAAAPSLAAVALQRAARQYADALWWADADPRIAWIKLFGALEAAANHWDSEADPDPVQQLKRRHAGMFGRLERQCPDALPVVAKSLSRVVGAETKMIDFVLTHAPGPPESRPTFGRLDWTQLEKSLHTLYDHRSYELHGGIPFPPPLCAPPALDHDSGVPCEAFPALAAESGGGSWPADRLPMYLHTFAYIAGEALRSWWAHLASRDADAG